LSNQFKNQNLTLQQFGLPEPTDVSTELLKERSKYNVNQIRSQLEQLNISDPLNDEQTIIDNHIIHLVKNQTIEDNAKFIYIQGKAGSGKTYLLKRLILQIRSMEYEDAELKQTFCKIVKGCCSTALACQNYDRGDFTTAHNLFCLPVDNDENTNNDYAEDEEPFCQLQYHRERLELLQETHVIIWDEFISNHRDCFESVYQVLNRFKGKVVICSGDFKQTLPIVPNGTKRDILNACIFTSSLWNNFTYKFTLRENMRLLKITNVQEREKQEKYNFFLECLATNRTHLNILERCSSMREVELDDPDAIEVVLCPIKQLFNIESNNSFSNEIEEAQHLQQFRTQITSWLFSAIDFNVDILKKRVILATTNSRVDEWNNVIAAMNPNEEITLLSKNEFSQVDDDFGFLKERAECFEKFREEIFQRIKVLKPVGLRFW